MLNKKYAMVLSAAVGATALAGAAQMAPRASGVDQAVGSSASVTVASACSMTGTVDTAHTATINPGQIATGIGQTTLKAVCNDLSGYSIYAVGFGQDTLGTTVLHSESLGTTYDIPTNTTGDSYWNMQLAAVTGTYAPTIVNNFGSAHAVPSSYTKVAQYSTATDATTGSSLTTTYNAKVSSTQPAGTYTGKVKYVLVHPTTSTPSDNLEMQHVDLWKGQLLAGETVQATDTRDGKTYYVAKLDDGKIWMTQNLDLCIGCTGTVPLTSENTDLNVAGTGAYAYDSGYSTDENGVITWTPAGSTMTGTPAQVENYATGNPASVTGWTNDNYVPYMAEVGEKVMYGTNGSPYASVSACVVGGHTESECKQYLVGNFYNWTAAIASNGSSAIKSQYTVAENSICPKGWRLPKGLTKTGDTVQESEFNSMLSAADIAGGTDTTGSTNVGYASGGFNKIAGSQYGFSRFGLVNGSTMFIVGGDGYWWSSTASSASNGYHLCVGGTVLYPAASNSRLYGFSVRCVAE